MALPLYQRPLSTSKNSRRIRQSEVLRHRLPGGDRDFGRDDAMRTGLRAQHMRADRQSQRIRAVHRDRYRRILNS